MQHLEVSCAVRRFFKSLGFKGLSWYLKSLRYDARSEKTSNDVTYINIFNRLLPIMVSKLFFVWKKPNFRIWFILNLLWNAQGSDLHYGVRNISVDHRGVEQRYHLPHIRVLAQYDCCHCVKLADYRRHTSCWRRRRLLRYATRSPHIIIISILTCRRGASPLRHVEVDTVCPFRFSFRRTCVCSGKAYLCSRTARASIRDVSFLMEWRALVHLFAYSTFQQRD